MTETIYQLTQLIPFQYKEIIARNIDWGIISKISRMN